jgi:hypothetical protein
MNEVLIGLLINLGIVALFLLAIGIKRIMRGRIQK